MKYYRWVARAATWLEKRGILINHSDFFAGTVAIAVIAPVLLVLVGIAFLPVADSMKLALCAVTALLAIAFALYSIRTLTKQK